MTIREVVEKAITLGCLNPPLSDLLLRALEESYPQDKDDMEALSSLQEAVRAGRVLTVERKRCFNIMEEMVWEVLESEYATLRLRGVDLPDVGDVAAYALNHLKPLYAVSEIGAEYQRNKVKTEHWPIVRKRVREALEYSLGHPIWHPDRKPIAPNVDSKSVIGALDKALSNKPGR